MAALSALVFTLSWWLGLYLLARDSRKPVLILAAVGLCCFAAVVAADAVRVIGQVVWLSRVEVYLAVMPGIAWFAVLLELARPGDRWGGRARESALVCLVAAVALLGAGWAGGVDGPVRTGHVVMFAVISTSTLAAMVAALMRPAKPVPVAGRRNHPAQTARRRREFGTTEQWRYYNSLYFPYVAGVRAYAQNATAAGLDPTARQAWQWLVTEVPQRSLHNWQNAAARLIAADLRGQVPVPDAH